MPFRKSSGWKHKPSPGTPMAWERPENRRILRAFPMWEGAGAKLRDATHRGPDGAVTTAVWTNGRNGGKALKSFGYVNAGTEPTYLTSAIEISISCWMWIKSGDFTGAAKIIADSSNFNPSTGPGGFWLAVDDRGGSNPTKGIQFRIRTATAGNGSRDAMATNVIATTSQWYHLVVTYKATTGRIYLNGIDRTTSEATVGTGTGNYVPINANMYIGALNSNANNFTGYIDDFRMWERALSAAEVREMYVDRWRAFVAPRRRIISQGAAAGGGLFFPAWLMNGISTGGPFFRNPLG